MNNNVLNVDGISVQYGDKKILNELCLQVLENEILCLLGQSGSGKTTVLKTIAGLLVLQQGSISLGEQVISSADGGVVSPDKRGMAIIFQDYALFPHMTVLDNICYGIKGGKQQAEIASEELLELVKMQGYGAAYPHELSGGQQQRVAIARALAIKPKVLLLDEPFSNVDNHLRQQLMADIRHILKQQHVSAVFVTHNKAEAFAFADTLAFMETGKIVQIGEAESLYLQPSTAALAESMGMGNWLDVTVLDEYRTFTKVLGNIVSTEAHGMAVGQQLKQFIRPGQLTFEVNKAGQGEIIDAVFDGDNRIYTIVMGELELIIKYAADKALEMGTQVAVSVMPHRAMLFE